MEHPLTSTRRREGAGGGSLAAELARLMPRARWLLDLLDQHQVLTTAQITMLCYPSLHRARYRLLQLHRRGILDRFRHITRPGSDWVFRLNQPSYAYADVLFGVFDALNEQHGEGYIQTIATIHGNGAFESAVADAGEGRVGEDAGHEDALACEEGHGPETATPRGQLRRRS